MSIIMWRRSVHDSHVPTPAAEEIAARALLEVDEDGGRLDGAILLLHDRYDETVEALAAILPALVERGYQLYVYLLMLMSTEGGMNPGGVYRCPGLTGPSGAPGMTLPACRYDVTSGFFCTRRAMGPNFPRPCANGQRPAPGPPKCKKMWLPLSTGGKYGILFVKF